MDMIKTRQELIKAYIDFFKSKAHKEIPNSSLIPENDPTVLFTTAGMHPLVPYLLGQKHPLGKRLVNNQKCVRTGDINKVGDESHLTFFEMLGNWSLGDYFKKEAIEYSYEFLTKVLKMLKEKLTITCFAGDKENKIPKDEEAAKIWQDLGIKKEKIKFLGREENWWGPAGKTGPCGPDTEMFFQGIEIWNDVFMQYNKDEKGNYTELQQKNVDTGMGVERTLAVLQGKKDIYETACFLPLIKEIEKLSKKKYGNQEKQSFSGPRKSIKDFRGNEGETRAMRIIADHIKASVFILAENIYPSNTEQGYVLRRLIRRAIRFGKTIMMQNNFTKDLAKIVIEIYPDYKHLQENKSFILQEIEKEENRFRQSLASGLRFFNKIKPTKGNTITGKDAFLLYQSYGFPIELTLELAKENKLKVDMKAFEQENKKHQELSRTATQGKFKSGLADNSEQVTKLHTATHLLNQALRQVLGRKDIYQKGSNITAERLRFDFNFDRKLTEQEIKEVENLVNKKISEGLPVTMKEMSLEEAKKIGAVGVFQEKYGDKVKVYSIGNFSREICAGPHVSNIKSLGKFKIIKEESSAAGVRRIKAELIDLSKENNN